MNILKRLFGKSNIKVEGETSAEYNVFISANLSKYKRGEYVLFTEEGVYDHGYDLENMVNRFKKEHPKKSPAVFKIPPKNFSPI